MLLESLDIMRSSSFEYRHPYIHQVQIPHRIYLFFCKQKLFSVKIFLQVKNETLLLKSDF